MFINNISASKLDKYDKCPRSYRYRYVDQIPEDFSGESNTEALQFGSYIHQIFEENYDNPTEAKLLSEARRLRPNYKFTGREDDVVKAIRNFKKFNDKLTKTIAVEQNFKLEIPDHDFSINGFIDRIVEGKDGGLLIIDYKTGRTMKTRSELMKDSQMMLYTFASSKLFNVPIEKIVAGHYYPIQDKLITVQLTANAVNGFVLKYIKNRIWEIRKKKYNEFPPKKHKFCDWCGYQKICPLFPVDQSLVALAGKLSKSKNFSV